MAVDSLSDAAKLVGPLRSVLPVSTMMISSKRLRTDSRQQRRLGSSFFTIIVCEVCLGARFSATAVFSVPLTLTLSPVGRGRSMAGIVAFRCAKD
jgi:hypothetical protein